MHPFVALLNTEFESAAQPDVAVKMAAYMRNQFDFLGLPAPRRKELATRVLQQHPVAPNELWELSTELWGLPFREYQYTATDLLRRHASKLPPEALALFEYLISHKSWWDSVDAIAPASLGLFLKRHPELITAMCDQWLASGNIWLIRSLIIFQLHYKENTDKELLFSIIQKVSHTGEFFIDKAIGWALRQLSRRYPKEVSIFVATNSLSPLTVREALKVINKQSI